MIMSGVPLAHWAYLAEMSMEHTGDPLELRACDSVANSSSGKSQERYMPVYFKLFANLQPE